MGVLIDKIPFEEENILNSSCNSQHFLNCRTLERSRRRKVYDGFETCLLSRIVDIKNLPQVFRCLEEHRFKLSIH